MERSGCDTASISMANRRRLSSIALALFVISASPIVIQPVVDRARHEVRFTAVVQPDAMSKWLGGGGRGHHAITWSGGGAGGHALFLADARDPRLRAPPPRPRPQGGPNPT